jgi:hypothetical protein
MSHSHSTMWSGEIYHLCDILSPLLLAIVLRVDVVQRIMFAGKSYDSREEYSMDG